LKIGAFEPGRINGGKERSAKGKRASTRKGKKNRALAITCKMTGRMRNYRTG